MVSNKRLRQIIKEEITEAQNKVIQSPLNYVGGKSKLLPLIKQYIPNDINIFYDIFGGGYNVGVNVNAKKHVYNDLNRQVSELISKFKTMPVEDILHEIDSYIAKYGLDRENKEGYYNIRTDYNKSVEHMALMFYTLIAHAFSNQIRFNSKEEFNMPFGKRTFSDKLRQKLITFCQILQSQDLSVDSKSFIDYDTDSFQKDDFVYLDPPYFNSFAAYNTNGGWTENDERNLWNWIDKLDRKGIRFMLSNNLKYDNPYLLDAMKRYRVVHLGSQYTNCNYHKKDKSGDDEILIMNY